MALDNIIFTDEVVMSFQRGDVGTISNSLLFEAMLVNIPLVQSTTPEQVSIF